MPQNDDTTAPDHDEGTIGDAFNPDALRLDQSFQIPEEEVLATVHVVDKPKNTWWFRIHSDSQFRVVTLVLAIKDYKGRMGETTFLVHPKLRDPLLSDERYAQFAQIREIVVGVTSKRLVFLWPLRIPKDGQALDLWSASRREAALQAQTRWTRMQANVGAGHYRVFCSQEDLGEPQFPDQLGTSESEAAAILSLYQESYPTFCQWADRAIVYATFHSRLHTVFDWQVHLGSDVNPRSLRNFPVQGNGAEMLRWACRLAIAGGIRVVAPVHDVLLVEGSVETIDDVVASTRRAMAAASAAVLDATEDQGGARPLLPTSVARGSTGVD